MYTFKDNDIHAHRTQARTITLVKGNSSVLYPFYTSSGINSNSKATWFPWMGYLDYPDGDSTKGEVYMVKPVTRSVSKEPSDILKKYLVDKAFETYISGRNDEEIFNLIANKFDHKTAIAFENGMSSADLDKKIKDFIMQHYQTVATSFISRMGNDEALAISCSLGGGEWDNYPEMREEIMRANSTAKFIKPIKNVTYTKKPVRDMTKEEMEKLIAFKGIACEGIVKRIHAEMATHLENLTKEESERYVSTYFIQEKKDFPTTEQVNELVQLTHARELRNKYVGSLLHIVEPDQPGGSMKPH